MFAKVRELKLPRLKFPQLKLPRWGRIALGAVMSAALLLPGAILVRSSDEGAPEAIDPEPAPVHASRSGTSLDPELPAGPMDVPGGFVAEEPTSLPPTPDSDPEPIELSTYWDAPAATELLAIETSTSADGDRSVIQLRANGSISNAELSAIADPDRLVIDLPGVVSAMESSRVNVDSTRVAGIRVGKHDDKVRIVLDSGTGAEGFEERLVEPAPDGLLIALGPPDELDGPSAEAAAEPQPPASIAPPDAPEAVQPAQERRELPLYLVGGKTAERQRESGPGLKDSYDCIIEPFRLVEVGSALTAVVASVSVERSDFVAEGQVLAQLEASSERATVATARARARMDGGLLARRARMELGGRKRNRADQLFESKALSVGMRDEISTEAKVAKAVVQEAREHKELMELEHQEALERLKEHTIRSPVSGVVVERLKSPGEVVKEETIVVVAQIDPLRVEVILPAAYFGSVETGMRAEVTPALPGAGVRVASVAIVDRVVDATSGTFGVKLEFRNTDHVLPSGLRCQVRFLKVD
jgi:RND family efflux transporter MFP subunit